MSQLKDTECNAYVKVYVEPGKTVKQQTKIVRGSKNPVFDNTLTFKNICMDDLRNRSIRLAVFNKVGSGVSLLNKRSFIGEVVLPLRDLGLKYGRECVQWEDLVDTIGLGCEVR